MPCWEVAPLKIAGPPQAQAHAHDTAAPRTWCDIYGNRYLNVRACVKLHPVKPAQCNGAGMTIHGPCDATAVAVQDVGPAEKKWMEFFSNPSAYWDNRQNKRNPRAPDFKHKDDKDSVLWLDSRGYPSLGGGAAAECRAGQ